jgi:colanic acid biosynthesis protein WcaH
MLISPRLHEAGITPLSNVRPLNSLHPPRRASNAPAEPPLLDRAQFSAVVANAPLVAFDLIVEDPQGAILLGMRSNPPARGYWFTPGGRIRKHEGLEAAFARITRDELGREFPRSECDFLDVCEHHYDTNFLGEPGATTHYIVLVHRLRTQRELLRLPTTQHSHYTWMLPGLLRRHPQVHPHVQAYFPETDHA